MKANLLALLTTLLITHLSLSARIVQVSHTNPVKIEEGESFRMLFARGDGYSHGGPIYWTEETSEGNVTSEIAYGDSEGREVHFNFPGLIIDGPGWVKGYLSGDGRTWARATIEILPTSEMQKYLPGGGGSSSSSSASGEQKMSP
jgi:hypothetical protein